MKNDQGDKVSCVLWIHSQGLFNLCGHRVLLFVGGLTYILYIGSYLSYNAIFVITCGAALGNNASTIPLQNMQFYSEGHIHSRGFLGGTFARIFFSLCILIIFFHGQFFQDSKTDRTTDNVHSDKQLQRSENPNIAYILVSLYSFSRYLIWPFSFHWRTFVANVAKE